METDEAAVRLENHEMRIVGAEKRIKDLEVEGKTMQKLVISVERIATSTEHIMQEQTRQGERLEKLEMEPAERWNSAKKTAFTAIVSTIAGALAVGVITLIAQFI